VEQLDMAEDALVAAGQPGLPILIGIETARGVANARNLLDHGAVVAGYFGAEDFIADMGGVRTESNVEVLHARSEVALAGRLSNVAVLDQVVVAYRDRDRFRREADEARAMGFAGKMCIHPAQVEIAHQAFTPSRVEVDFARRVLDAHEASSSEGRGVSVVDGRMIDEPLVAQARRVLDLAAAEVNPPDA
jgi:citrate lyase subunit beta/citryl-CoA lyase